MLLVQSTNVSVNITVIHRVRNILSGVSEADKILHSSNSFVILPDMKWDPQKSSIEKLYLVAISKNENLRSIRDLRASHIGILKEIKETTLTSLYAAALC